MEHTLLAGLELGRQDSTNKRNTGVFGAATLATVPASAPFAVATSFPGVASDADNNVKADTTAVYLQDQIALAKEWKLLAGLRYDHFKTAFDDSRPVPTDLARTDKEWSPRLGLIWSPTPTSTYYASYSYAFLPSGEQLSLAPNTADLAPEKAKNYEIGGRWDLLPEIAPSAAPAGARLQLVPQNTLSVWNRFDAGNGWGRRSGRHLSGRFLRRARQFGHAACLHPGRRRALLHLCGRQDAACAQRRKPVRQ